MRHVNNATYLTYCEIARLRYWTDVTGEGFYEGNDGAESLILAEARITYRAQALFGETVIVAVARDKDRDGRRSPSSTDSRGGPGRSDPARRRE